MRPNLPIQPGEEAIIADEDNKVLYSDFAAATGAMHGGHLLDILRPTDQDVLRVVGAAIDRPGRQIESEVVFRGEARRVRVIHSGWVPGETHIYFGPAKEKARKANKT